MRAALVTVIVGILTMPSLALAQGQASTMMVVSVRVVRPPAPRTEVTTRTEVSSVAIPAPPRVETSSNNTYAQPDATTPDHAAADAAPADVPPPGYQVNTINY